VLRVTATEVILNETKVMAVIGEIALTDPDEPN